MEFLENSKVVMGIRKPRHPISVVILWILVDICGQNVDNISETVTVAK